MESGTMILNGF